MTKRSAAAVWPASARRAAARFIASAQLPSGAIASHSDRQFVDPYLANLAAWGLAAQCDRGARTVAIGQLRWYAGKSKHGPVTDHAVLSGTGLPGNELGNELLGNGLPGNELLGGGPLGSGPLGRGLPGRGLPGNGLPGEQSTGEADSHDAYDATFLSAFAAAWRNSSKAERKTLAALRPGVARAVERILRLQQRDGLTWAKPDWQVKYLMDQVEVFWGLSQLSTSGFLPAAKSRQVGRAASKVRTGIQSLWNPKLRTYSYARHADGTVIPSDPATGYPDAASQLWAIASGIPSAKRAGRVRAAIAAALPQLSDPQARWTVDGRSEQVGYWPLLAHAYTAAGKKAERKTFTARYEAARTSTAGAWPYNVGAAGLQLLPADPSAATCVK